MIIFRITKATTPAAVSLFMNDISHISSQKITFRKCIGVKLRTRN